MSLNMLGATSRYPEERADPMGADDKAPTMPDTVDHTEGETKVIANAENAAQEQPQEPAPTIQPNITPDVSRPPVEEDQPLAPAVQVGAPIHEHVDPRLEVASDRLSPDRLPKIYVECPEVLDMLAGASTLGKIAALATVDSMGSEPATPARVTHRLAEHQDLEVGWSPDRSIVAGWMSLLAEQGYLDKSPAPNKQGTHYTLTALGEAALNIGGAVVSTVLRYPMVPVASLFGKPQSGSAMNTPAVRLAIVDTLLREPERCFTQMQLAHAVFPGYEKLPRHLYRQVSDSVERLQALGLLVRPSRQDGSNNPAFRISREPQMPDKSPYVSREVTQVIFEACKVLWDRDPTKSTYTMEDVQNVIANETHSGATTIAGMTPEDFRNKLSSKFGHLLKIAQEHNWGIERVDDEIGGAQELTRISFTNIQTATAMRLLVRRVCQAAYDPGQHGRSFLQSIFANEERDEERTMERMERMERKSLLMSKTAQAHYLASSRARRQVASIQGIEQDNVKAVSRDTGVSGETARTILGEEALRRNREKPAPTTKPAYVYDRAA
jgi:hypothetical protein